LWFVGRHEFGCHSLDFLVRYLASGSDESEENLPYDGSSCKRKENQMKKTIEERKEYAKIIAQAWVDEELKRRLIEDPATILKENGIEIPEGMTVKVVEQKENEIQIPLPLKPEVMVGSVEELQERVQKTVVNQGLWDGLFCQ
jgi:hypothetical protein